MIYENLMLKLFSETGTWCLRLPCSADYIRKWDPLPAAPVHRLLFQHLGLIQERVDISRLIWKATFTLVKRMKLPKITAYPGLELAIF